jgi:hypothetical protein
MISKFLTMMRVWKPSAEEIKATEKWGEWSKEVSDFPWYYDDTETCYILKGEATVKDSNGNEVHFGKGDMVQFKQGVKCTWNIRRDIRKKFIFG